MNRIKKLFMILCFFTTLVAAPCFADAGCNPDHVISLCTACSSMPDDEACFCIPDGFFSAFDDKSGEFFSFYNDSTPVETDSVSTFRDMNSFRGELKFTLEKMQQESPYVYSTEGKVRIVSSGSEQLLTMEKIDYVVNQEDQRLYYRLTCIPTCGCEDCIDRVYLLGYACGEDTPVLVGNISYVSDCGNLEETYPFHITGRNPFDAECHLQRKLVKATSY